MAVARHHRKRQHRSATPNTLLFSETQHQLTDTVVEYPFTRLTPSLPQRFATNPPIRLTPADPWIDRQNERGYPQAGCGKNPLAPLRKLRDQTSQHTVTPGTHHVTLQSSILLTLGRPTMSIIHEHYLVLSATILSVLVAGTVVVQYAGPATADAATVGRFLTPADNTATNKTDPTYEILKIAH